MIDEVETSGDNKIESLNGRLIRLQNNPSLVDSVVPAILAEEKSLATIIADNDNNLVNKNDQEYIVTSLSNVREDRINTYANAVGKKFGIPKELRLFAAYFCKVVPCQSYSIFTGKNYDVLRLDFQITMSGYDYLEALRVVLKNPKNDTVKFLTGNSISDYSTDKKITIDYKIFPEYGLLSKCMLDGDDIRKTNQFVELLKIPQRGRTFYAGAIGLWLENNTFFENPKSRKVTSITDPMIEISSQTLSDYAKAAQIDDYAKYLKITKQY